MAPKVPTEEEVLGYMESLSNWNRWGSEDEMGTLNLITPQKRRQAALLVQDGVSVSCSRPITTETAPDVTYQVMRYMVDSGEGRDPTSPEGKIQRRGAGEFIGMVFHGHTITHIDTPSHYFWKGKMYNNRSASLVTAREGAQANSIESASQGIVTRGVLLDVAKATGKNWYEPAEGVMPEDLEAAEEDAGIRVESGDLLLVRTGNYRRRIEKGPVDPDNPGSTACHVSCAPWFHERNIAMMGSDTPNDIRPPSYPGILSPLHIVSLVAMGMPFIDNCNLEDLAKACEERKRWEFMITIGPLRLQNVTGSPVNPIAVF